MPPYKGGSTVGSEMSQSKRDKTLLIKGEESGMIRGGSPPTSEELLDLFVDEMSKYSIEAQENNKLFVRLYLRVLHNYRTSWMCPIYEYAKQQAEWETLRLIHDPQGYNFIEYDVAPNLIKSIDVEIHGGTIDELSLELMSILASPKTKE